MTANETDRTAQALYQAGILSYPRTDSRYIGENLFSEIPSLIQSIGNIQYFGQTVAGYPSILNRHSVDDDQVTGHHALLPTPDLTQEVWDSLDQAGRRIIGIVATRVLQSFARDCEKEKTDVLVETGGLFTASGTTILKYGWHGVANNSDEDEDEEQIIPALSKGEILNGYEELYQGMTKSPALFTERSLILAMKHCGNELEDKLLKKTLNQVEGIGRPATRSGIIETLFERKYCIQEKGRIIPTELGFGIYEIVKSFKIANPELTAEWENKLDQIANGNLKYTSFISECKTFTTEIVGEILSP